MRILVAFAICLVTIGACKKHDEQKKSAGSVCVEGTNVACTGGAMKWTGSKCCVEAPVTCVQGTNVACVGAGMSWTGSQCCVTSTSAVAPECVDGTNEACVGAGMHWTGNKCCVEK